MHRATRRGLTSGAAGYTLMELLVATGLLVLLGTGLATFLRQAIEIWHRAETRGRAYEQGRVVLDRVAADLRAVVINSHVHGDDPLIRFIADRTSGGRQRLRFVRSVDGEAAHPVLREGGQYLSAFGSAVYDGHGDADEARDGLLAAPEGMMEVLYRHDPATRIVWRGVRSPIGGPASFFGRAQDDAASDEAGRRARALRVRTRGGARRDGSGAAETEIDPRELEESATAISRDVLHLGFRFWTPTTTTWDDIPPLTTLRAGAAGGPSHTWDSTQSAADRDARSVVVGRGRSAARPDDGGDDIFPELVEVTLVVAEGVGPLACRLTKNLSSGDLSLEVSQEISFGPDEARFVLIDEEWLELESVSGRRMKVARRGARDTEAKGHERGARVEKGVTFRRVVEIPAFRLPYQIEEEGRGSRYRGRGAR